jgi:hypothetical protein
VAALLAEHLHISEASIRKLVDPVIGANRVRKETSK